MSFNSMIQQMGRADRKGGQSTFVLFTLKWSEVKDPKKIINRKTKKTYSLSSATNHTSSQFFDSNWPRHINPSSLSAITIVQDDQELDNKSIVGSVVDSDSKANKLNIEDVNLFSRLIITDAIENQLKNKKTCQTSKSDIQNQVNLPDEIFNYIYVVYCRKLFILA